jgi:glutamate--cysteine ligase
MYCLISESPLLDDAAWDEAAANQVATARRGRDPEFRLMRDGRQTSLEKWAGEILDGTRAVAELIDRGEGNEDYTKTIDAQAAVVRDPETTPSARLLAELRERDCGFFTFAMEAARGHKDYFRSINPLPAERLAHFVEEAEDSTRRQEEIERTDSISLDKYLENYFTGT